MAENDPLATDESATKTTVSIARVAIRKNPETTRVAEVMAHEVPVLRVIHGENLSVLDEDIDSVEIEGDPESEMARLRERYRRRLGENPADVAYRNGVPQLADAMGFRISPTATGKKKAQAQHVDRRVRKPKKAKGKTEK